MKAENEMIKQADQELLVRMVIDGFRRIIIHYGAWFAEVEHQVGLEKALATLIRVFICSGASVS